MYEVSEAFHTAIRQPAPQVRALLDFGTVFFDNEDIAASAGIYLTESVNLEEDLTIGSCTARTFSTTIFNENHLLDDFPYGLFIPMLGVLVASIKGSAVMEPYIRVATSNITGGAKIKINGITASIQPGFTTKAFWYRDKLYAIGDGGQIWSADVDVDSYNLLNGQIEADIHPFLKEKFSRWAKEGRSQYWNGFSIMETLLDGTTNAWEYCPLSGFISEVPTKRKTTQVQLNAYDAITAFDVNVDDFINSISYPITLGELFENLCGHVGLGALNTDFPNADMVIDSAPSIFSELTGRELLSWIAEAAGGFCRMTRDAMIEICWFEQTDYEMGVNEVFAIDRAEVPVMPIDKLQVSVTDTDIGVIVGDGDNGYQIIDNPFLYGKTDEEVRAKATPIFNQIASFPAYYPASVTGITDLSVEPGDIIAVSESGVPIALPVFVQNIAWNGGAPVVTIECTGNERRPVMSQKNRQTLRQGMQKHEFEVSVEQLRSDIINVSEQQSEQATTILQDTQQILLSALESYVKTQDYDAFKETVSTSLRILSDQIELNFVTSTQQINSVDGNMQDFINEQVKYIRFIDGNIVLGEEGNAFVLQLENDRISFLQNGTEIAYFANYKIHAADGEFENSVSIGNFQWVYLPDGSFALV